MDGVNMMQKAKALKRGYHHGDLRRELVAAAFKLLDEEGVDAVTVRAVARSAEVAHSAPANHFKDRSALLTELAVVTFKDLATQIEAACETAGASRRAQLVAFAERIIAFAFHHPHRYRLLWRTDLIDQSSAAFQTAGGAIYEKVHQVLAAESTAQPQSIDTQVIAAWSIVHGYISLRLDGTLVAGTDEQTGQKREKAIVAVLMDGLDH